MRVHASDKSATAALMAGSPELLRRIGFVLLALVVYRLGTHVPLPGLDALALSQYQGQLQQGLFGMFNMFSGGAFSRMTIFALSIMPYITASIILMLAGPAFPTLNELRKEGEVGRRKINQYTRYLTVLLAFGQGFGLAIGVESATVPMGGQSVPLVFDPGLAFRLETAMTLMAGTMFLMWLGEQINTRGIGNGISVLIFAGIVAELPAALYQTIEMARVGSLSGFALLVLLVLVVAVLGFIVFMESAQRRVAVQYPKRQMAGMRIAGGDVSHLPFKLNPTGVIPVILSASLMMVPMTVASYAPNSEWAQFVGAWFSPGKWPYLTLYVGMIVFFCFFTLSVMPNTNPKDMAENLKNSGGFVPGIRPGTATATYFDFLLTRLTVVGAAYVSAVCVLPEIINAKYSVPFYFGGTSLLIVVSVMMDLVSRIQTHLLAQRYEGLMKKAKLRPKARRARVG